MSFFRTQRHAVSLDASRHDRKTRCFLGFWMIDQNPGVSYSTLRSRLLSPEDPMMHRKTMDQWDLHKQAIQAAALTLLTEP